MTVNYVISNFITHEFQRHIVLSDRELLILYILKRNGRMKPLDIQKKSQLSLRSVRYYLLRLRKLNLVQQIVDLEDSRSFYYDVI